MKNKQKGFSLISVLFIIGALVVAMGVVLVWQKRTLPAPVLPSITPTQDTDFISWEEAKQLILTGRVEQVHEFHNLTVNLLIKDGTTRTTREPKINAIFKFINQCGEPCSSIMKAME